LTVRLTGLRFARKDSFVAYVGFDTRVSDSGKKVGRRRLTKRGDSTLRWLLYVAAQATLRTKDPYFRAFYERKCQEGLPRTAAICVLARKLAKIAWSLSQSGETYRPERVGAIAQVVIQA
jgi:transposase